MEHGLAGTAGLVLKEKSNTTGSAVPEESSGREDGDRRGASKVQDKKTIVGIVTRQEGEADKENLSPIAKKPEASNEAIVISSDDDADYDEEELLPCLAEATEDNIVMVEEYEREETTKKEALQLLEQFFRLHPHLLSEVAGPRVERTYLRKCRVCGWAGASQKELDQHKIRHVQMDRTSRCRLCHMVFFDSRDLKAHEKSEHQKKHQCVYCEKYFRKAAYLEKHTVLHRHLLEGGAGSPVGRVQPIYFTSERLWW
jgi:hypothetical protein